MKLAEQLEVLSVQDRWERPERTLELIREGLRSPDEEARSFAAGLAIEYLSPDLADEVEPLLDDPSDWVRAHAIMTLGAPFEEMWILDAWGREVGSRPMKRSQFRRIRSKLETIYRDAGAPDVIRRRALEALVRAPEAWHLEAVRSAWSSDDPPWRATAVRCMGHLDEDCDAQILEALHSDSPVLKDAALSTLYDVPLEGAAEEVLRLVADARTPRDLHLTALEVLTFLHPRGSLEAVEAALASEDEDIAKAAEEALGELVADDEILEELAPYEDLEGEEEAYGLWDGQCAACDDWTRVNDMMMCEDCAGKLERDMIRERHWDYSASAWACPEDRREELRAAVIQEHGAKLELIAPSTDPPKTGKPRKKKRKRRRKK